MGEQVVSGRTRGEHGRGLDLDRITAIQGHTFVCPKTEHLTVLLKNGRKYVVNGEVISEDPIFAEFRQHRFATKDDNLAELLRQSSSFQLGEIKELETAKADSAAEKARKIKEALEADPDLKASIAALMKSKDGDEPTVQPKAPKAPKAKSPKK
jgi:hypothetical protein